MVYGLYHAPVLLISDFEGGILILKEEVKW